VKINDSSLWPDELGDLRFETQEGSDGDFQVLSSDGAKLALLVHHEEGWLPGYAEYPLSVGVGWELVLPGRGPEVLDRRLLLGATDRQAPTLNADVIAWATLTILTQMAGRIPGRG
jgi:hypothetical protein